MMEKYFRPIDADQYARQGIVEGKFIPIEIRKTARIKARRGSEGEEVFVSHQSLWDRHRGNQEWDARS